MPGEPPARSGALRRAAAGGGRRAARCPAWGGRPGARHGRVTVRCRVGAWVRGCVGAWVRGTGATRGMTVPPWAHRNVVYRDMPGQASVRDANRGRHECRPALVRDASRGRHECRPYGGRPATCARTATTGPPSRPVGAGPGTRGNRVAIAPGTIQTIPFLWWPRDAAVPAPASVRDAGRGRHECRPALVRDASRGRHECRPYARGGLAAARPTGTAARTGRRALTLVTAASSSLSPSCLLRMPWLS